MIKWLNISLPMIVPVPSGECVIKSDMIDANNSGDDAPAAMKVAPATSSGIPSSVHWSATENVDIQYTISQSKKATEHKKMMRCNY